MKMTDLTRQARKYLPLPQACHLVSYGTNIVAAVRKDIKPAVEKYLQGCSAAHGFETPGIHVLDRLLEPFGLNGYGCCDDLSEKLDGVLKINNLRRVAVCPWADIAKFTPVLQKNYIMTWKPKPMPLAADTFDGEIVKKELENGLQKAKGGVIELILRDTHTCKNQPERFGEWVKIARQAIDTVWE